MFGGFYTFGGRHFWEDVFFYQKWRIQRNNISKKYRLLDSWDICRHEGTFEDCRKTFIKCIEVFEIPRQKGHMVIMIPGLGESKNIFQPLWRAVLKNGFLAAAINYPSTQKEIDGHVKQLDFFLNHLEDVDTVSFVSNGCGSVILKSLFTLESDWKKKFKIGRIVEVAPMNHGSEVLKKLSKSHWWNFLLGPMAKEMDKENIESIPNIPENVELGIILSHSVRMRFAEFWAGVKTYPLNEADELNFEKAKDVVTIKSHKWNRYRSANIVNGVVKFLVDGKF